jgi:hypothetical protein
MMKINILKLLIILLIVFTLVSCNDPIFYIITKEPRKIDPLIDGSPTNFAEYDGKLYVASGRKIFSYSNNSWSKWTELNGRVGCLAATTDALYALYLYEDSGDGRIRNFKTNNDLSLSNVQSIHASEDVLFACVRNDKIYNIYFRKEGNSDFTEITNTSSSYVLRGAVSDNKYYYLCFNDGIFYIEKSKIDTASDLPRLGRDYNFTGIINLNIDCVAAISEKGELYEITRDEITDEDTGETTDVARIVRVASFNDSRYSTGALAVWYNGATPTLLLAGRYEDYYSNTSAYSNGYVEITLDTNPTIGNDPDTDDPIPNPKYGRISGSGFREPGDTKPTSIDNKDRYTPSLGKRLINYIIQTPAAIDANMTMFASTQQDGVWSYRLRDGVILWNAEE